MCLFDGKTTEDETFSFRCFKTKTINHGEREREKERDEMWNGGVKTIDTSNKSCLSGHFAETGETIVDDYPFSKIHGIKV